MYIVLNENGDAWNGVSWGWDSTRRFLSVSGALRELQEAGEDIDRCHVIEDFFVREQDAVTA